MRGGYKPLPTNDGNIEADSAFNYKSIHAYNPQPTFSDMEEGGHLTYPQKRQSLLLILMTHLITAISYTLFVAFLPVTYWICIKKLGSSDRLIVFRLGKLLGTKGPGRVLIFPWMDRCQRVDMSASAFSVPPQQFITFDGGIVEMGAEVQFGITDPVAMIKEVADHQDIIRSLGKTLVIRLLVKKNVVQLQKEKKICGQEIMDEMNTQVRKWGMDVRCVSLSDAKILKLPENSTGLDPILRQFGVEGEKKPYPSPIEFARTSGNEPVNGTKAPAINSDMHEVISAAETGATRWGPCLENILQQESLVDDDTMGLYHVLVTGEQDQEYFIQITATQRCVMSMNEAEGRTPDVKVKISNSDLAGVLKGSLPPLQAYLSGRISATGDVRKLMLFDKLSNRGHKPGATFNI